MGQYKQKFLLSAILLLLAVFLRLWRLDQNPPSLNWDEVSHGYNAYSILKTGRDEWGIKFPVIFRAFGDYKLPVYIYLTVVSVGLFGLSEMAVRLPSAILGVLGVLGVYLLVKELSLPCQGKTLRVEDPKPEGLGPPASEFARRRSRAGNWRGIPLIAAFLLAIEPWHLFLSRVAVEANVAVSLIIAGAYFFLRGLKSGWPARQSFGAPRRLAGGWLVASSLCFGLSLFTYNSARVFVPLLVASLVLLYWKDMGDRANKGDRGKQMLAGIVFLVFFLGMIFQGLTPAGQARYRWVSLIDEGAIARINEARGQSSLPGVLPRVFYNKGIYFTTQFIKNYLAHFSPQFLFFKGGTHYQFNLPNEGLIYPIQIPFILLGLWYLFKKRKENFSRLIFAWLILAPFAGSLTRDSPHTLRAVVMLPIWQVLAAVGVVWVFRVFRNKKLQLGFIFVYLLSIIYYLLSFLKIYFGPYRKDYSWVWQYGYKQAVEFIKESYDQYDKIIITKKYGEPHEFILFYWPWEPEKYRADPNLVRYFQTNWYWVDRFDKFEFVNDWEIRDATRNTQHATRNLLITSAGNYPEGWRKIETINFLDGKPAFEILEN